MRAILILYQLHVNTATFLFNQRSLISFPAAKTLIKLSVCRVESSVGGLIISQLLNQNHPRWHFFPAVTSFEAVTHIHTHPNPTYVVLLTQEDKSEKPWGLSLPDQSDEVIRQNLIFPQIAPLISSVFPATITLTPSPH